MQIELTTPQRLDIYELIKREVGTLKKRLDVTDGKEAISDIQQRINTLQEIADKVWVF